MVYTVVDVESLLAGTTGKIAGRIVDAESGEPLTLANVLIEGTSMGAASDFDGYQIWGLLRCS